MRYSCNECEYVVATLIHLTKQWIEHEEGYPCDICEYVASQAGNLKQHIKSKHKLKQN